MVSSASTHRNWRTTALCVLMAVTATLAFCPPTPFVSHRTTSLLLQATTSKNDDTVFQKMWKRMDTLEACGLMEEYKDTHPPLVARGGGFQKFMIIMGLGIAYKWYRARFINKIPFWEKQPQWNMVVTNKEQEEQLRAYTCQNCGATIFIARNREWFFEGGTGLAGLGCYSCGAKGKENFVMDRDRIVETVGDDDDYWDFERPLDFVSAAERKEILRQTKGDEEAANQLLMDAQNKGGSSDAGKDGETPPPMFGLTVEEADAKAKAEAGDDADTTEGDVVADDDATEEEESPPEESASDDDDKPDDKGALDDF